MTKSGGASLDSSYNAEFSQHDSSLETSHMPYSERQEMPCMSTSQISSGMEQLF